MQFFDVELIDRLSIKLEGEWKKLYMAVERRSLMLEASVSFHKSSEQVSDYFFSRFHIHTMSIFSCDLGNIIILVLPAT